MLDRVLNQSLYPLAGLNERLRIELGAAWRGAPARDLLGSALYHLGSLLVGVYARLRLDLDVVWQSPLPKGPKVFAANHPSTTDPFLMVALLPEPVSILIHDTLFRVPLFGRYLRRTGHVRVVPGDGQAACEEALRLLRGGRSVLVFPEGGISPLEGGFGQPRSGVARLALRSGAPVIPLGIHLPRERIRLVETWVDGRPDVARWYLHGPYAVTGGAALHLSGDAEDRAFVRRTAEHVMEQIACLAEQSARRLSSPAAPPARPAALPLAAGRLVPLVHRGTSPG
jgi:1-acyl-sn-glycerol-3-phosphate acyltransferase